MYDVVIVGGGIAGCVLAEKLIRQGINVVVVERTKKLKKDSGIVSNKHIGSVIPKAFIEHKINKMSLISPSKSFISINTEKPFAFILNRQKLNKHFLGKIKGFVVYDNIKNVVLEKGFVQVIGENSIYYGKIVVGCDGAASIIRKCIYTNEDLSEKDAVFFGALAYSKINTDTIRVYFDRWFSKDFFAWSIPQTDEYGLMTGENPVEHMEYFRKTLGYEKNDLSVYPMTVGMKKACSDRMLLAGEAAGYTKPITGGGIDLSITSCLHAARIIKTALKADKTDCGFLGQYEYLCKNDFGTEIKNQMFFRNIYKRLNNKQIDELLKIAKDALENIDNIDDYTKLSDITNNIPKAGLFFWAIKNLGVFTK